MEALAPGPPRERLERGLKFDRSTTLKLLGVWELVSLDDDEPQRAANHPQSGTGEKRA
jgi:hypothetical protein